MNLITNFLLESEIAIGNKKQHSTPFLKIHRKVL